MASIRKVLRNALPSVNHYDTIEGKENKGYVETPNSKRTDSKTTQSKTKNMPSDSVQTNSFRRNTSVTQSVRDVVGSFRQKLKKSTRQRKRLEDSTKSPPITPASRFRKRTNKRTPTRKGGYREVKMYSPFTIETPRSGTTLGIRTKQRWNDIETPTRLRKEVEDLTANMQALVNLTPRTLQTRAASRRSLQSASPLTNGSLNMKTPKSNRRVTITTVRRHIQTTAI